MLEDLDDVKQALNIKSMRNMSNKKVMELVELMEAGQLTEAGKVAVFTAAPQLVVKVSEAMDATNEMAMDSNNQSSASFYDQMTQSKEFWAARATDPNATEEERRDARDRYERVDERLADHDVNNKHFNLKVIDAKKGALIAVAGLAVTAVGGLASQGKLPQLRGK